MKIALILAAACVVALTGCGRPSDNTTTAAPIVAGGDQTDTAQGGPASITKTSSGNAKFDAAHDAAVKAHPGDEAAIDAADDAAFYTYMLKPYGLPPPTPEQHANLQRMRAQARAEGDDSESRTMEGQP